VEVWLGAKGQLEDLSGGSRELLIVEVAVQPGLAPGCAAGHDRPRDEFCDGFPVFQPVDEVPGQEYRLVAYIGVGGTCEPGRVMLRGLDQTDPWRFGQADAGAFDNCPAHRWRNVVAGVQDDILYNVADQAEEVAPEVGPSEGEWALLGARDDVVLDGVADATDVQRPQLSRAGIDGSLDDVLVGESPMGVALAEGRAADQAMRR